MTLQWMVAQSQRGELEFVEHGKTGTVHALVPHGPEGCTEEDPVEVEFVRRWLRATRRHDELFGPWTPAELLALMPKLTMCGQLLFTAPWSDNGIADCFADDRLCASCHRTLGEDEATAFEHCRPDEPSCEHQSEQP
jgi:hypothetical protein